MTRTESQQILDRNEAAIYANVDAYLSKRITYAEFSASQRRLHDEIDAAGMHDQFSRRWRAGTRRLAEE